MVFSLSLSISLRFSSLCAAQVYTEYRAAHGDIDTLDCEDKTSLEKDSFGSEDECNKRKPRSKWQLDGCALWFKFIILVCF